LNRALRPFPTRRSSDLGSAEYKVRLAKELELDAFCEDDVVISRTLAKAGVRVFLFDQPWNREVSGERITRVAGWTDLAQHLDLSDRKSTRLNSSHVAIS